MTLTRRHLCLGLLASCCRPSASATAAPTPPRLLLAREAHPSIDPAPYLVSEKLDGVRACWDGRQLLLRSGRAVTAPAWFLERLPAEPVDGELWLGRRRFDEVSALVRKAAPPDAGWRGVQYQLFEAPQAAGPFEARYAALRRMAAAGHPFLRAAEQFRVADNAALRRRLADVVHAGGEGLMLHRADAPYVTGRSDHLLKLKPLHDREAVVVGHVPGQGRYRGMLGALELETPEERRFRVGTGFSDAERREPPALGATVTYTYRELTPGGLPRFASFLREVR